jgi:hypothetical protein
MVLKPTLTLLHYSPATSNFAYHFQIRQISSRYAVLAQPQPLTPVEIRRREAERIPLLAPASAGMKALDFKANRATAMNEQLSQYRITWRRSCCRADGDEFERQTCAHNNHNKTRKDQDHETRNHHKFDGTGSVA